MAAEVLQQLTPDGFITRSLHGSSSNREGFSLLTANMPCLYSAVTANCARQGSAAAKTMPDLP
jgi:hypothetical protein